MRFSCSPLGFAFCKTCSAPTAACGMWFSSGCDPQPHHVTLLLHTGSQVVCKVYSRCCRGNFAQASKTGRQFSPKGRGHWFSWRCFPKPVSASWPGGDYLLGKTLLPQLSDPRGPGLVIVSSSLIIYPLLVLLSPDNQATAWSRHLLFLQPRARDRKPGGATKALANAMQA